jgi:hypothetical protein
MEAKELIQWLYDHPEQVGIQVGFKDLTANIHGEWMREMIYGDGDYTLMAHRSSYKSSCLSVAIALMMVLYPTENIIFLRKADKDVSEMMGMVNKALSSRILKDIVSILYDRDLIITESAQDHLSTNLWTSPMGAPQLLGLGVKSSITGKHSMVVITDDICNTDDRKSRAERENTKQVYQELHNICNRDGRIINLGTKWHDEDVFTLMPNQHIYTCYDTGLMTQEQIQKKREEMEPALFAANYELKVIDDGAKLFSAPQYHKGDVSEIYNGRAHIDAAYGGSDYTAYTILKKTKDGYIGYGMMWQGHVDSHINDILALHKLYRAGSVAVERNGDKGYLSRDLRKAGFVVVDYNEKENKYLKIATYLKKEWKNIHWLPDTDPDYIRQILRFTENAEHDDAPDSAASLLRQFEKCGHIGDKASILYGR